MSTRVECRSKGETRKVATLVHALQHVMKCRVLALLCCDADGAVFITPQPGREKEIFAVLDSMDWRNAKLTAEEFFVD
jgi:hypothetical protein